MNETIINGIDVSECKYYDDEICCNEDVLALSCDKTDCIYKQLIRLQEENEELKEAINRLQKDCKRNNDLYMKEWDKNYKLSEISKEYNARRCIEKLYRLICDDTKSVQETYITLKDEVSEFLRIHKTMSSKYEEAKQTYKQALEEIRNEIGDLKDINRLINLQKILDKTNEVLNDRN